VLLQQLETQPEPRDRRAQVMRQCGGQMLALGDIVLELRLHGVDRLDRGLDLAAAGFGQRRAIEVIAQGAHRPLESAVGCGKLPDGPQRQ
jgi:hypothetical protein